MEKHNKISPQTVPVNYFESLSDRIMKGIEASRTESEPILSDTLASERFTKMPHSSPDNDYFDKISSRVLDNIRQSQLSEASLEALKPQFNPGEVPAGYFQQFSDRLVARIQNDSEDLVEPNEVLSGVSKEMPFELPKAYFIEFKVPVTATTTTVKDFTPSHIHTQSAIKKNFFKSMRWSSSVAAALVFIILGWGAFILLNDNNVEGSLGGQVAVQNTESPASDKAFAQLDDISNEALSEYLEGSLNEDDIYILMDYMANTQSLDHEKVEQQILNGISSEDIQSFLEYEGML